MRRCLALLLCVLAGAAQAKTGTPSDCSGSVGASAANVAFPASGKTGNPVPSVFVTIQNTHATQNLCVAAAAGDTASCSSGGGFVLGPTATITWPQDGYPVPAAISVIGSGSSTTYHCEFQ